ncbi:MAG: dTDP-4-dehydrorhamnose reductase, partial [Candidatus Nealsonbacteria bacterium]|nr:dTDP-4-dehydrorhamnose reductase [Candidatus Nealsonbacteria bacterium]
LSKLEIIGLSRKDLEVTNYVQVEKTISRFRPDVLINTSAYHAVPICEKNPLEAMAVNFLAVKNLARLCQKKNIFLVTFSTDYVFDGEKKQAYSESDEPAPLQVYGLSKLAGEEAALRLYHKGVLVIRTAGLYGGAKGAVSKGGNFVLNIMKEARDKKTVTVRSDQVTSTTYAGDLSRATLALLKRKASGGVYHLTNEGHCSWYEFAKEIYRLAGITKKLIPVDRSSQSFSPQRPKFSVLKNNKAKKLGVVLPTWRTGLKSYFAYLASVK